MAKWITAGLGPIIVVACGLALVRAAGPANRGVPAGEAAQESADADLAKAAKIIGPEQTENNCATCHAPETEAWQNTRHYATFNDRHRSPRAQEILKAMGERSMKRSASCRGCHYTSIAKATVVTPLWGVSCESCHGPGKDWNAIHNRPGGNPSADALKWGAGKSEASAARQARLAAGVAKGMIHSDMTYEIAANCFGCHTVPSESLVNTGGHHAGSDFDLVAWSQGEIRHNFASSPGAPDKPTNRPATADELRRLYVVGAMVDLEVSLRNLTGVKQKGGAFHTAMIDRVNRGRKKVDGILKAVPIPEIAQAVAALPATVTADTPVAAAAADALRAATRQFAAKHDGSSLGALDPQIPKEVKGKVHRP